MALSPNPVGASGATVSTVTVPGSFAIVVLPAASVEVMLTSVAPVSPACTV